jgi:hypothetical protein
MIRRVKLYFVCKGTSTNDVIDSIKKNVNVPKKTLWNLLTGKKNEKVELSKLDSIGITQIGLASQNSEVFNLLDELTKDVREKRIYTSLEYSAIESCVVLFNGIKRMSKIQIYPLVNMSNNTNITSKSEFEKFMQMFSNKIYPVKDSSTEVNWEYINPSKQLQQLNKYNFTEFMNNVKKIISSSTYDKYMFISDANIINEILKKFKSLKKYNKNIDIIEQSSIWEIEIEIKDSRIMYKNFTKIYPRIDNYEPLTIVNINGYLKKYKYMYKGYSFELFNALEEINPFYLKKILNTSTVINSNKKAVLKSRLPNIKNNTNYAPTTFEEYINNK